MVLDNSNLFASGATFGCLRTDVISGDNITIDAAFSSTTFIAVAGATELVNVTKKDVKYLFNRCDPVGDSIRKGCYFGDTTAATIDRTTTISAAGTPGDAVGWVKLVMPTSLCSDVERCDDDGGVDQRIRFIGLGKWDPTLHGSASLTKVSGSETDYQLAFFEDTGSGFTLLGDSVITVPVSNRGTPLPLLSSATMVDGDLMEVYVRSLSGTVDIVTESLRVEMSGAG